MSIQAHRPTRSLSEVERDIQANRKALYRAVGGKFDVMDAGAWQWAWDRHPDLYARSVALNAECCDALYQRRDRQQAKAKVRHQRRVRAVASARRAIADAAATYQFAA